MLLFDRDISGVRCAVWHVTESIAELLAQLPEGCILWQEAQMRFKSEARQKEWIAVRVLLHALKGADARIVYTENGAPELEKENTFISISHTKGYVCLALSDKGRVGVDIEQMGNKIGRVRSRFVREDENINTLRQLLVAWSAKESAFKLLQRTDVDFKEQLQISGLEDRNTGNFPIRYQNDTETVDCIVDYEVFPNFVLTIAQETDK